MLVNKAATPRIKINDKVAAYDAFIISEAREEALYIYIGRCMSGAYTYFVIREDGSSTTCFVESDTTFMGLSTDEIDYIYAIDITSIRFDKITYYHK